MDRRNRLLQPRGLAAPGSVLRWLRTELSPNASHGADCLFAGCVSVLLPFLFGVRFPCNALTCNRGKQQSSERRSRRGEARGAALRRQTAPAALAPGTGPSAWRISVLLPPEACSKCSARAAAGSRSAGCPRAAAPVPATPSYPTASRPRRGGRDRGVLAAPFPGQRDLQFNKRVWVSGGVKSSRWRVGQRALSGRSRGGTSGLSVGAGKRVTSGAGAGTAEAK